MEYPKHLQITTTDGKTWRVNYHAIEEGFNLLATAAKQDEVFCFVDQEGNKIGIPGKHIVWFQVVEGDAFKGER